MEGFPQLPGYSFPNLSRSKHTIPHYFEWHDGYPIIKRLSVGIGGEPLNTSGILYLRPSDSLRFDPSLTYGRTKSHVPSLFKPHFVLYDKKCLTFRAFFKQSVVESPLENYRVRKVNIIYFLEDDTLTVMEPPVLNSGIPQGRLVARDRLIKDNSGAYWNWKDLNVGMDMAINGIVYHVVSCDLYTREFLISQGVDVNADEDMPSDPYEMKRKGISRTSTTPRIDDKLRKFLEFDGKVLRFNAMWDNRDTEGGEMAPYIIHYFLSDDTIEICKMQKRHITGQSKEMKTLILNKVKIPKNWRALPAHFPSIYMERRDDEVIEYYEPKDFIIGNTVFLLGRRFLLYDCDAFTRRYYSSCLNIEQGEPLTFEKAKEKHKVVQTYPPYLGFGTPEDSIQSWFHFQPKRPKTDLIRYLHNMNRKLRYTAVMDFVHPEDESRQFIVEYRLSDGSIMINELRIRNSGFAGGKFLKPTLLPLPGCSPENPTYYTPNDLNLGAILHVFGHRFKITGVDLAVYRYMEANPEKFKPDALAETRKFLVREGLLNEDIKDIADYRLREEVAEPTVGGKEELQIVRAQDAEKIREPMKDQSCYVAQPTE